MEAKNFMQQTSGRNRPTPEQEEEFMLLISLSLDNLVDEAETAQFEQYLTQYSSFATQWQEWQRLHQQFDAMPHAEPAADFVGRFEARLIQQERRQQLWLGVVIGSVTFLLWLGVMAGLFSMGAYLFANQGSWLSALIQNLTYAWVNVLQWVRTGWSTFETFAGTPQAKAIGSGYLVITAALLMGWLAFLRHSLQLEELPSQAIVA